MRKAKPHLGFLRMLFGVPPEFTRTRARERGQSTISMPTASIVRHPIIRLWAVAFLGLTQDNGHQIQDISGQEPLKGMARPNHLKSSPTIADGPLKLCFGNQVPPSASSRGWHGSSDGAYGIEPTRFLGASLYTCWVQRLRSTGCLVKRVWEVWFIWWRGLSGMGAVWNLSKLGYMRMASMGRFCSAR